MAMRLNRGLNNFVFPYSKMDIPTSQPFHMDTSSAPDPALRTKILGAHSLQIFAEGHGCSSIALRRTVAACSAAA